MVDERLVPTELAGILCHYTQRRNPPDFDYRFNLTYGRQYTEGHAILSAIRASLDDKPERRAYEGDE